MRIAVATPTFLPVVGGAELGIHEIFHRLGQRHDVTIVTRTASEKVSAAYASDAVAQGDYKVRYVLPELNRIGSRKVTYVAQATGSATALELLRLHKEQPLDIVNCHFLKRQWPPLAAVRAHSIPTAVSLVGRSDVLRHLKPVARAYAEVALRTATVAIANSSFYLEGVTTRARPEIVPYGVDTDVFRPEAASEDVRRRMGATPHDLLLVAVQRLAPIKRVDVVIRAIAALPPGSRAAKLAIVGQGEERQTLERLVDDLGIRHLVTFVGFVPESDLPSYFASADAFIFHSLFETFGIVFAQAMASGLPILAARSSCIPEVVGERSGLLTTPTVVSEVSAAIVRLREDPDLLTEMGQYNRDRAVREFEWDRIADAYEMIFERLRASSKAQSPARPAV